MPRSKYREERTLVRGIRRFPSQDRTSFRSNVLRLKRHFEQFNIDVAELCQWLMGIRPGGKRAIVDARPCWEYLIDPSNFDAACEVKDADRLRLSAFDLCSGIAEPDDRTSSVPEHVLGSISKVKTIPTTKSTRSLFSRLSKLQPQHRMILLKSAANWVSVRYLRGYDNWLRQFEVWEREKAKRETEHPTLTPDIRTEFNSVFEQLGVKTNRPRVCSLERLSHGKHDCEFAGDRIPVGNTRKSHSALCVSFWEFAKTLPTYSRAAKKYFVPNAKNYLKLSRIYLKHNRGFRLNKFFEAEQDARKWFGRAWDAYLQHMNVNEDTLLNVYKGDLPHCVEFKADRDCTRNKHTNECTEYHRLAQRLPKHTVELEAEYREWRRQFLRPPRKPVFEYPSATTLPVPKIFGSKFYYLDLMNSIVGLRLDDMGENEFLEFSFKPWPEDYDLRPSETDITSISVTFTGTKARLGFRFRVSHKESRIRISQDDLDKLRSRTYPRASQDQEFLTSARSQILDIFEGESGQSLRILTVDLGTEGAAYGLFRGREFLRGGPLPVVKIDKLYETRPDNQQVKVKSKVVSAVTKEDARGVSRQHVTRHLEGLAEGASKIAEFRAIDGIGELRDHDYRKLTAHIRMMIRDWVRLNASQITKIAEKEDVDLVLFESMRGFSAPGRDKLDLDKKRRLAFFAFGNIRRKVTEKAVERGMRVVTVPYRFSSQMCSECGHLQENRGLLMKNKKKRRFICERCGFKELGSDANAARVLGRVFWGELGLPTS